MIFIILHRPYKIDYAEFEMINGKTRLAGCRIPDAFEYVDMVPKSTKSLVFNH